MPGFSEPLFDALSSVSSSPGPSRGSRRSRGSRKLKREEKSPEAFDPTDPARNFLDLNPHVMLEHHWPEMRSRRPRYEFFYDPRLRTFARALQVLCIELQTPGTVFWPSCEPISSYHALAGTWDDSREALTEMYFRVRGVLRRRANTLVRLGDRLDKGEQMEKGKTTLETQLWNAGDHFVQALEAAKAKHVVSFLKSYPAQKSILIGLYPSVDLSRPLRLPSAIADDPGLAGLARMDDSDEEY